MKLILKNCTDRATAQALRRAFQAATAALDIDYFSAEVHAEIKPPEIQISRHSEHFYQINASMGATVDKLNGNVASMQLYAFNTPQLVHTFIHELTHVAQMLRGELKRVHGVVVWKGRRYRDPKTYEEYQALPWEREAEIMSERVSRRLV